MAELGFVMRAAAFDAGGPKCHTLSLDEAIEGICGGQRTVWLDLVATDHETAYRLLRDRLGFHELAVEDALSNNERPALAQYDDTVFFVIPTAVAGSDEDNFIEVAFFLTEKALVTVANQPTPQIAEWFDRWIQHPAQVGPKPAVLVHSIVDAIVDAYFPIADAIEDEVDLVSDAIFEGDTTQVHKLLRTKRRLLELRRRISPTRDVLNSLLRRDLAAIPDDIRPYLQDVLDHVLRISDLIDMNRDTLASMLDVHLSTVSNNVNVILKKMTVLSTVLMTGALVAGIYGMNFEHMPELKWMYGYPFALGLMVTLSLLIMGLFKLVRWL